MNRFEALSAFQAADDAWEAELVAAFGKDAAGDLRFTRLGRGDEGSALRRTYDARTAAHDAWLAANNCGPARPAEGAVA